MLAATLKLYRECAVEAFRGLSRSAWAIVALFLATPVLAIARHPRRAARHRRGLPARVHPRWGGRLYLYLVSIGVVGRRRVALDDLQRPGSLGTFLWDVIGVLFIFWIASLLIGYTVPVALLPVTLIATLVFNPAPEMIYQGRFGAAWTCSVTR